MRKNLLFLSALLTGIFASAQEVDENGYTTVNVSMQPSYASQVYFEFETNAQTPVAANSWDLAFEKAAGMGLGAIRVNDGRGIRLFEASNDITQWGNIDVAGEAEWTELYNSDITWSHGAFSEGSNNTPPFGFGWGAYNMDTHHVTGTVVFVMKYNATTYRKIIIEDYDPFSGTTTFRYAAWNGTEWSEDQTASVTSATDEDYSFSYYSLENNTEVTVGPQDSLWDMVFRKYYTNVGTDEEPMMYNVTGALQSADATVAQTDETGETSEEPALPATESYSADINTIGDDWKSFNQETMTYVVDPETTYYVKDNSDNIYRMYFTSFEGQGTGNLSFKYKNVTPTAGVGGFKNEATFGVYPNPSADGNVTLFYDLKNNAADNGMVTVYAVTGAKVFETSITNNSGFYTKEVNLSSLTSGIYIVRLESGKYSLSQKLVIK